MKQKKLGESNKERGRKEDCDGKAGHSDCIHDKSLHIV
jgi:hypothetical protein